MKEETENIKKIFDIIIDNDKKDYDNKRKSIEEKEEENKDKENKSHS